MSLWDYNAAGTGYEIGSKCWDYNAAGTGYALGKMWDYNAANTASLIWQARQEIFNPGVTWVNGGRGNPTIGTTAIIADETGVDRYDAARTSATVALSGFNTLYVVGNLTGTTYGGYIYVALSTSTTMPYGGTSQMQWKSIGAATKSISLAGYQGNYYIWFVGWSDSGSVQGRITSVYAE